MLVQDAILRVVIPFSMFTSHVGVATLVHNKLC
jgi:hypothetical protein